jgi:hypothetical protein
MIFFPVFRGLRLATYGRAMMQKHLKNNYKIRPGNSNYMSDADAKPDQQHQMALPHDQREPLDRRTAYIPRPRDWHNRSSRLFTRAKRAVKFKSASGPSKSEAWNFCHSASFCGSMNGSLPVSIKPEHGGQYLCSQARRTLFLSQ